MQDKTRELIAAIEGLTMNVATTLLAIENFQRMEEMSGNKILTEQEIRTLVEANFKKKRHHGNGARRSFGPRSSGSVEVDTCGCEPACVECKCSCSGAERDH